GWKFSEWELKGIPLRIEIGPRDLKKNSVTIVKRNTSEKIPVRISALKKEVPRLLEQIQGELYKNAEKFFKSRIERTDNEKEMIRLINDRRIAISPMCSSEKCEDILKEKTGGAKTLFIDPKKNSVAGKKCIICGKPAKYWVYIGKTY
ncbi:MAG TPA: His/Gly/Thr/Pro-type tRNA ligase C-terminal domain-containing protein, partial [Candidatus Omnitrophota bacterium]|nr:His/Gly/Thr/Pro-type tRNA ligase C-terminal domain-containing protein [Candidatus Omnitrophota bacterium]